MKIRTLLLMLVLALSLALAACDFGQVEQGRCVAFDPASKSVTIVLDSNSELARILSGNIQ